MSGVCVLESASAAPSFTARVDVDRSEQRRRETRAGGMAEMTFSLSGSR